MGKNSDRSTTRRWTNQLEVRKRKREIFYVLTLTLLLLVLIWVEVKLFGMSQSLPVVHSVFFIGLVNFNIIIFLLLAYLIFRNIVKSFAEAPKHWLGGSLKSKLVLAFVTFSFVPTTLMFMVSVFYINNSFDKWFSEKMAGVLKSSLEVTNAYYLSARNKNFHFAHRVAESIRENNKVLPSRHLEELRARYSLDSLEFYTGLLGQRYVVISKEDSIPEVPPVSLEFLKKGVSQELDSSTIHHFEDGNLVRVIVPAEWRGQKAAIVVSSFVPLSLITKMDDIAMAYEDFRDVNPLEYPLKSIYLIILILMTFVILLGATWFGFYLARQLSIPIEELGEATKRVANRDYQRVQLTAGSSEINHLIENFNSMTSHLEYSENEVREANKSLRSTLARLDEHSRYIEVVLSNVSTGVISVDDKGLITMINHHAASLLGIEADNYVGKHAKSVLQPDYYEVFSELLSNMKKHRAERIQKEVRIMVGRRQIPLQMTLSLLYDEKQKEIGKVVVFDDLTPVLSAQRAAAWSEVARRIAHEIKNPLTPIRLSAQRLQKKFGDQVQDPAFAQSINMIIDQVDSLKTLVNEFNNFARLPKSNPTEGDLNQVVQEALNLFVEAHKSVSFEYLSDPRLPRFRFDQDQIKRVITNLVDNSLAALKGVATPKVSIEAQFDSLLKMVRINILDNGSGIPEALRDRVFEPYMTTKEHGTGLGLSIVKRMVEDHNGFIRAFANEPQGTRIVIELPVIELRSEDRLGAGSDHETKNGVDFQVTQRGENEYGDEDLNY